MSKPQSVKRAVVDVPADDPAGTMQRFTDGLRRVLSVRKTTAHRAKRKRKTAR
jgi:hypothetical protein